MSTPTIESYLSDLRQRGERTDYIEKCLKKDKWDVHVGLVAFHEDAWAIGCGFPGNYSVFHVMDYRKYKRAKGRKKFGTEKDYWFEDHPDMNKLVRVPLETEEQIRARELEWSRRFVYNFPARLQKHFDLCDVRVQGQVCHRSDLSDEEITVLESLMTEQEIRERNEQLVRVRWSDETPSIEFPIRLCISGIDDGVAVRFYATVEEAMKDAVILEGKTWNSCDDVYDFGFKRTD